MSTILYFKNPANDYVEVSESPGASAFLFGSLYFAYKRAWAAFAISIFSHLVAFNIAPVLLILSWCVFAGMAKNIVRKAYLRRGWIEVAAPNKASASPDIPS